MSKWAAVLLLVSGTMYAQGANEKARPIEPGSRARVPVAWGTFEGEVVAKWSVDGRRMMLVEPFAFTEDSGTKWVAPKGSIVDGASIPMIAWSVVGGPFEGKYRDASVIYDVGCTERSRTWEATHLAFYKAMLVGGVPEGKAKVMYAMVYHFGPRWFEGSPPLPPPTPWIHRNIEIDIQVGPRRLDLEQGLALKALIEERERTSPMTLEQIRMNSLSVDEQLTK